MIEALVHSLGYSTGPREPVLRLNEGPPRVDWGKDMIQRVCSGCEEMFLLDKLFRCEYLIASCPKFFPLSPCLAASRR